MQLDFSENDELPCTKSLTGEEVLELMNDKGKELSNKSPDNRYFEIVSTCHYKLPDIEYFGAKHSYDPEHPQFEALQKSFGAFVDTAESPVVLVEGSLPEASPDLGSAIKSEGERGFVAHLARERGVAVECVEPSRADEAKFLREFYTPEQIEYYYFLRAIRDYYRKGKGKDEGITFDTYAEGILASHKEQIGELEDWQNFDFSLDNIKRIHKSLFYSDFDTHVEQSAGLSVDPRGHASVINEVSARSDQFRDFHHLRKLKELLETGRQVFIVNGEGHAVVQRPVLEKLLNTEAEILPPERYQVINVDDVVKAFDSFSGTKLPTEIPGAPETLVVLMWETLQPKLDEYIERFEIPARRNENETDEQFLLRILIRMKEVNQGKRDKRDWSECPEIALGIGEGAFNCVFGSQIVARVCERNDISVEAGLVIGHFVAVAEVSNGRKLFIDAANTEIAELKEEEEEEGEGNSCTLGNTLHGRKMLAYTRLQHLPIQYSVVMTINNLKSLMRAAQEGNAFAQQVVEVLQPDPYTPYETAKGVLMPQYVNEYDSPEWLAERDSVPERRAYMQSNFIESVTLEK